MTRFLAILLGLLLPACVAADGLTVGITPVPLLPAGQDGPAIIGKARFVGLDRLGLDKEWFGGWSGLAWNKDQWAVVSDRGHWAHLSVRLAEDGRPSALKVVEHGALDGLKPGKEWSDAEELAVVADGYAVSFERRHRVLLYRAGLGGASAVLDAPPELSGLAANAGIEAMVALADGRWLLIAEGAEEDAASPAWLGRPGQWRQVDYAHHGPYRPTGATALPDGGVVVVERRFTWLGGAGMRLVHLPPGSLEASVLQGEEWARIEAPLAVDNFESVAVSRRQDGRLVAHILADDNFSPLQSTLLLTLLLP